MEDAESEFVMNGRNMSHFAIGHTLQDTSKALPLTESIVTAIIVQKIADG